jgi:hypothetical protein
VPSSGEGAIVIGLWEDGGGGGGEEDTVTNQQLPSTAYPLVTLCMDCHWHSCNEQTVLIMTQYLHTLYECTILIRKYTNYTRDGGMMVRLLCHNPEDHNLCSTCF